MGLITVEFTVEIERMDLENVFVLRSNIIKHVSEDIPKSELLV